MMAGFPASRTRFSALAAFALSAAIAPAQVVTWSGTGDWSSAANWSSNPVVPGATSLVEVSTGTLTLSDTRFVTQLTLSGGTLTGAGTLNVSGLLTLGGATLGGSGTLNANGSAALTNTFSIYGGQTLTLNGNSTWSAGTIYHGGAGATLNNAGTLTNTGNTDTYQYYSGTPLVFNNSGTFTKTGATGTTTLSVLVTNTGTINVQSGTLALASGSSSGTVNIAGGTTLDLTGGSFSFTNGAQINGTGTVRVSGGTTTFSGTTTNSAQFAVTGGTATFNGTTSTSGGGTLSGGTLNGTGTLTFGGPLTLASTTLAGSGTITANGGAALTNTFSIYGGQTLTLNGNSTWSAGTIYHGGAGATLNNAGTLINTGNTDTYQYYSGTPLVFNNSGTFTKTGATGTTTLSVPMTNTGTINVQSGTLALASGSSSGTVNIATGTTLDLVGGSFTFSNGARIDGAGTVRVSGGTTTFSGTTTNSAQFAVAGGTATFNGTTATSGRGTLSSGTLNGTGSLTFGGPLTLAGATLGGSGAITANGGAALTNTFSIYGGQTLTLNGNSTWSAGTIYHGGAGATLNNAGTLTNTGNTDTYQYYSGTPLVFNNSGTFTKTGASGTTTLNVPLTNTGVINVHSGTLALASGTSSGTVNIAPGTTLDLTGGSFTFSNGAWLGGAGTVRISGGTTTFTGTTFSSAQFAIAGGTATFNGATATSGGGTLSSGTLNGTGTLLFGRPLLLSGTTLGGSGTIIAAAGANLTNTSSIFGGQTLTLYGNSLWSAGTIYHGGAGATLNNAGTLTNTGNTDTYQYYSGTPLVFNNSGVFTKAGASGTTTLNVPVINTGLLDVQSGTLALASGSSSGNVNVARGATLDLTGGSFTFSDGAWLGGSGTVRISGGTTTFTGTTSGSAQFALAGGTATFNGTTTTSGGGTLSSGTLNGTGTMTFGRPLVLSGATLGGSGTLAANAGATLTNTFSILGGQTLNLYGNSTWSAGTIYHGGAGATLNNFGTLTNTGNTDTYPYYGGTPLVFNNAGIFTKTGAAGTTTLNVPVTNTGTINVQSGTLALAGGSSSGIVNVAAGAALDLIGGSFAFSNGAWLGGSGTVRISGGTTTFTGTTSGNAALALTGGTATFNGTAYIYGGGTLSSGTLNGTGTLTFGGPLTLAGATLGGSGTVTATGGASLVNTFSLVGGQTLTLYGNSTWSAGTIYHGGAGATLNNAGTLTNTGNTDTYQYYGGTALVFNNSGVFVKTGGTGTTTFSVPVVNTGIITAQSGTLAFGGSFTNTGGTLLANGGNLTFANALNVGTGKIGGSGTLTAPTVTAGGIVAPGNSTGILSIAGNLTLLSTASSQFEIGGTARGTSFDGLNVSGTATLGGALDVYLTHASYATLLNSDTFPLLNAGTLTGSFANVLSGSRLASANGAGSFLVTASGTTLTLSQFLLDPSTRLWAGGDLNTAGNVTPSLLAASTVPAGTNFAIYSGADHDFNGTTLTNNGIVDWAGGRLRSGDNGSIVNNATFNDYAGSEFNVDLGNHAASFVNAASGIYRKLSGTTNFYVPFLNSGTIDVTGGTLNFQAGGTLASGSTLFGRGLAQLAAGTLTATGTVTVSDFLLTGGQLAGTQTFSSSTLKWLGTTFNTSATTTLASGTVLSITSTADHDFNGHAFVNNGIVEWTGGRLRSGDNGTFTNNTTFLDAATSEFNVDLGNHAASFVNAATGSYRKTSGTTNFYVPFLNSGMIEVTGGAFNLQAGGTLASGSTVFGNGLAQLSAGTLTASGNVTLVDFLLTAGQLAGTQTFSGTPQWLGTTFNNAATTTIAPGSTFNIVSSADHDFNGHAFVNNGTVVWTGGRLRSGDNGTFTNNAVFTDSATSEFNVDLGNHAASFVNAATGTYQKLSGVTNFYAPLLHAGTIDVTGGSLLLRAGGTFADGSTVTATGSGIAELAGGVLTVNDTVTWNNFNFTGGQIAGTQTFSGSTFSWLGGDWNTGATTTFASNTSFNVAGAVDHDFNAHAFVNQGVVNWISGRLRTGDNGTFTNAGTVNDTATSEFNGDLGNHAGSFVNAAGGLYRKVSGTTNFYLPVLNSGTIDVVGGAFNLQAGGTFASGSTIIGSGTAQLAAGTLTASGTVNVTHFLLSGGQLAGSQTFNGTLDWLGTTFNNGSLTTIGTGSTFTIASTADHDFNAHLFVNQGSVEWITGRLRSGDNGTFTNFGTFNDYATSEMNGDLGNHAASFVNAAGGTYNKLSGTTNFYVPLTNAGTINVTAGALNLQAGGTFAAGSTLNSTATAQLVGGTLNASGLVTVSNFTLSGGQLAGTQTFDGSLTWQGSALNGAGTTTIAPSATLTLAGAADHDYNAHAIANQGTVVWTGGRLRSGDNGSFVNYGTLHDSATSEVNGDLGNHAASFTNNGVYLKTAGTTTFTVPFINNNGLVQASLGTIRFQSTFQQNSGTLALVDGGTLQFDNSLALAAGYLLGSGNVIGNVVSAGVISPSAGSMAMPGQLNITGNLSLQSLSAVSFQLGGTAPGTGYDFLSVSGAASLGGANLGLTFTHDFHTAAGGGNTFTLLSAASLSGTFANVANGGTLLTADGLGFFTVNYGVGSAFGANSVVLSNFVAVPEPSTWVLMLSGLGATALLRWRRRQR